MTQLLLLICCQLSPIQVQFHTNGTTESRLLLRAIDCDIPSISEDMRTIRHYQDEIRRVSVRCHSVDTFIQIGRNKARPPQIALDTPAMTVLWIKRECDLFNAPRREYAVSAEEFDQRFIGIVDLGDEGKEIEQPQPWEDGYELTAWQAPRLDDWGAIK